MGTLIGMHYPTSLFANLADHAFVRTANGHSWKCWGGDAGGKVVRKAEGSSRRADAIAQPDEKANIKCYLVSGVCHQAANRVLLPASITVRGVRGYSISHALFGTYGRVGFFPCKSPFRQYSGTSGDLPAKAAAARGRTRSARPRPLPRTDADKLDYQYIQKELEIYRSGSKIMNQGIRATADASDAVNLHLALFMHMAEFNLGPMLDRPMSRRIGQVRKAVEKKRHKPERAFQNDELSATEFADHFDGLTRDFQSEMANAMHSDAYRTLFDLSPDEQVVLADPRIVKRLAKS